ncbi:hypothetical protein SLG_04760 [Sphingobium sp. SYK-6]|nr:hypothetical protein SLG_04760 [Sphingobium sp. SYK-6]
MEAPSEIVRNGANHTHGGRPLPVRELRGEEKRLARPEAGIGGDADGRIGRNAVRRAPSRCPQDYFFGSAFSLAFPAGEDWPRVAPCRPAPPSMRRVISSTK